MRQKGMRESPESRGCDCYLRTRSDKFSYRSCGCDDRFIAARSVYRSGGHFGHRRRRFPGSRHFRNYDADYETQLPSPPSGRSPRVIKEAFHIATTGRPGPVLIDIPKDVATFEGEFRYDHEISLPGYQPVKEPNYLQIRKLVEAVSSAKKPVILAGAGVLHGKASEDLKIMPNSDRIPVAHTLLGLGGFRQTILFFWEWRGCTAHTQRIWRFTTVIC